MFLFSGPICPNCLRTSRILFQKNNYVVKRVFSSDSVSNKQVHYLSSKKYSLLIGASKKRDVFNTPLFSGSQNSMSKMVSLVRWYSMSPMNKHVSAMVAKRPVRKKAPSSKAERDGHMEVNAYAIAKEFNLSLLRKSLETQGLYVIQEMPLDVTDGLHVQAKYSVDLEQREIFFFTDGSAVFWNMPEVERSEVLKFVHKLGEDPNDMSLVLHEHEQMPFKHSQEVTGLIGEVINICEAESEEGRTVLEKYTFSNALAQAVNLGVWEATLEKFVDLIEPITQDLRDGKKIRMSRREVLRRTGELFALRHVINLSSDLLDTPDFYWDRESLEPLYQKACNHLNITRRTRVMNERLSHLCELMELLSTHLNDTHHTRLEWMIIILILVEVVFEIVHYVERYVDSHQYQEYPVYETKQPPA